MSFSSQIKKDLSKMNNLANKQSVKYELIGYLISNNIVYERGKIKYSTTNEYNINRFSKLISNLNILNFKIELKGKTYTILLPKIENIEEISYINKDIQINKKIIDDIEKGINPNDDILLKSLIRGIFLGSGSVNNPENKYHLEFILSTQENAQIIENLLFNYSKINTKRLERKKGYSLYIKDGEQISNILALIGANSAVLKFEQIRVLRDMKNNINRKVNCETANLSKTVDAAVKQIEKIKELKKNKKFEKLPENLKQIANLRLQNPDATLTQLGQMLDKPIGKSGVNHRLNQIMSIN